MEPILTLVMGTTADEMMLYGADEPPDAARAPLEAERAAWDALPGGAP